MRKLIITLCLVSVCIALQAQHQPSQTKVRMKYTILVLYKIMPSFLNLERNERNEIMEKHVAPLLISQADKLQVRMFDSEAFHAKTSDFLIIECADLRDYYYFMEQLRDTPLFGKPYMELNDIVIGLEDGFKDFETTHGDD